ncbi:MAG: aldehyde dehydrogenase family protein [Alphaproteobacteria bacterium]
MQGCAFIADQWQPAAGGQTIDMICPSDNRVIGAIARCGTQDVDQGVAAARAAFDGHWGRMSPVDRGRVLSKIGRAILDHEDELTELEAADTGKPLAQARNDVIACARYFEFYGGSVDKLHGETLPYLNGYQVLVLREPRGVTGHIIPWNYPLQMFGRTIGGSLAAGNATVMKPAEEACLSVLRVAEIASDCGLVAGALNIVPGLGEEAGAALAGHAGIDYLSFTGSAAVGTLVQQAAAVNHTPCVLELGGKSPQIIFADGDLDAVLPMVTNAIVQNAGQTCSAGSRALIQRDIYDEVMASLAERIGNLRVGSHAMDLDCGPVISAKQKARVEGFLARAAESGIATVAEGTIDEAVPAGGFYVKPTLFEGVPAAHELAQEEVFGPVLTALPFKDEADAIAIGNGVAYGLVAGVWTKDGGRQLRMAKALRVGQVFINSYGAGGGVELPFGGVKKSGHGREKGLEGLREFTVSKTIVLNHG